MGWKVVVDEDLGQGHGVCEAEAAGVFEAPPKEKVRILDASPGDARRAAVEAAVKYCPTHALRIVDDG
jgi:ferredoxin